MSYLPDHLREQVIERAGNRCEYCGLAQEGQEATFHVDHVIPIKHDGETSSENLALACVSCSLHKAARLDFADPETGQKVALFNPRTSKWSQHFRWSDTQIEGLDACGRATIVALKMNRPLVISIREEEKILGRHPQKAN